MSRPDDPVSHFYLEHLQSSRQEGGILSGPCPFCRQEDGTAAGKIVVVLNQASFFHGYFRCLSRCVPGGYPLWFASLAGIEPVEVPGYDPDADQFRQQPDYPVANQNAEMQSYHHRLSEQLLENFRRMGVLPPVLRELQIGFNGRYLTYPYLQTDGNCYALRCVFPDRPEDFFWHGDDRFFVDPFRLFNVQDIDRCAGGALFLCEGEENLLVIRQLGYPGVAVPHWQVFETLDPARFAAIQTLFLVTRNSAEADSAARELASRIGYKVRLLSWPAGTPRHYSLCELAREQGKKTHQAVAAMIRGSTAFSPFASPDREYHRCLQGLAGRHQSAYAALRTGFGRLDEALEGLHGINVIGGAPKVGKSAFVIQIAGQVAEQRIPVLYYDFENGRQRIYQRILSRLARLPVRRLGGDDLAARERQEYELSLERLRRMLLSLRVVNDRRLTPELMRRHIDFIRHETRSDYTVVVIDSLHKLPFKDFAERRTGIDAWLRQLESIRDEMQVSFLVISELARGNERAYSERPHLGVFKGSGDIEYSADNAMVLFDAGGAEQAVADGGRRLTMSVVASREHRPGPVADYRLDYPYWGFIEEPGPGDHEEISL